MIPIIFWMITSVENASSEASKDENPGWKGFPLVLHVLLPIAGLALLWGQRGIFAKLLLQLDRSCVSVYCPSLSKREKLLKWASGRLPSTWSSQARTLSSGIPELWKDGSLLCTLINSVIPGACPNPHRHWKKPPLHAQALAYKYLGLAPMFSDEELSSDFTMNQERNFIYYLQQLQEAINNMSTKDDMNRKFSSQYVARGMGLYTGEQHRKTVFYVYSNGTIKRRSNVLMYIRGPYGTLGKATISPFHNLKTIPVVNVLQDQLEATKILPFKNDEQKSFLKTISLDFTSLISNGDEKNEIGEIPIQIDMEIDRAKITYIPNHSGIYEINLISDGELLKGSPYNVQVVHNTSGKKDTFNTETEDVKEKITFTKRKVLSKVIDCIDEKICIDNNNVTRIESKKSSTLASEKDDLTITAITKKKDEILKTEINCTLEDIIEEINLIEKDNVASTQPEKETALTQIKNMAEELKSETDDVKAVNLKVDTQHKLVENCKEATKEIVNLLHQDDYDEVDNKVNYENNFISDLDINLVESTKFLKNIVNTSNKQGILEKILPSELWKRNISDDENNNSSKDRHLKRINSKIHLEISPRPTKLNNSLDSQDSASPICPDHIVPEVEKSSLNQMTLSEKRKTLSKQNSIVIDNDSVFSSIENNGLSKRRDSDLEELSVLNVLDSLRQSRHNSLTEPYSLSSTVSLPNMTSLESNYGSPIFKARKDYWERLSSRSSSSVSLANSDHSHQNIKQIAVNKHGFYYDSKKFEETTKSADNLSSLNSRNIDINRSYNSSDTSLDDCSLVPLEERKKQLLKEMYEKEKRPPPKKLNINLKFFKKSEKEKNKKNSNFFTPISDRIKTFDKTSNVKTPTTVKTPTIPTQIIKVEEEKQDKSKRTIKLQFKKAIHFFKNLEENSKGKNKNVKRSLSFDYEKKEIFRRKEGGSLNISDRFSVNNLYDDVIGNRRGSFKGTPNNFGVANSLASLSMDVESEDPNTDDGIECISYNLFVNKLKSKKRKSIKTLFDISY